MTVAGEARNTLSRRSSNPPCPGNMFPESLTFCVRFSSDSQRSPHVEKIDTTALNPIHCPILRKEHCVDLTHPKSKENASPPKNPSHDFFGEIRSKRRCFPMGQPTIYAPVSFIHIKEKKAMTKRAL